MIISLKHYLDTITYEEQFKPEGERRDIPAITALADEVGVSRMQLYKLMNNKANVLNLSQADKIIQAFRRRGFEMDITDLLEFRD